MKWLGRYAGTHDAATRDHLDAIRDLERRKALLRLIFRAPILDGGGELPAPLRELEFGCELAFVQAYAPKSDERVDAGGGLMLDKHQLSRGDHRVAILVHPKDRGIYVVAHYKAGKI